MNSKKFVQSPFDLVFEKAKDSSFLNTFGVDFEECEECDHFIVYAAVWPKKGRLKEIEGEIAIEKIIPRQSFSLQQFKEDFGTLSINEITPEQLEKLYVQGKAILTLKSGKRDILEFSMVQGKEKQAVFVTPTRKRKHAIYVPLEKLPDYPAYIRVAQFYDGVWEGVTTCALELAI